MSQALRSLKILAFGDTHLGIDSPLRPRIVRRRRGEDFERNLQRIIQTAIQEKVDLAIHGGDIFYRSRIPPELTTRAFDILSELPEAGIPLYIVPGNHERSKIPHPLLAIREGIFVFDSARTFVFESKGMSVALGGFPFHRNIREVFSCQLRSSQLETTPSDFKLLCLHQAIEGATVGVQNYTFRQGNDVIPCAALADLRIDGIVSGHIHRAQILSLPRSKGDVLPVIYPGSIERTAMAERNELKGFFIIKVIFQDSKQGNITIRTHFRELPARPMIPLLLDVEHLTDPQILDLIQSEIRKLPMHAIVAIQISCRSDQTIPSVGQLRKLAPDTMNVSIRLKD